MRNLRAIIEKSDANYSAYIDGVDGIAVTGNTIAEIESEMREAIEFYKETCMELNLELPEELSGEYQLSFETDPQTLLEYFDGILGKPALEKITGVNQKQLWHYAMGKAKPRKAQKEKILNGLHRLGDELRLINI